MEKIGMIQNKKIIIGIVPTLHLYETEDPYQDHYEFVNNYPKKIYEAGAIPIGLLLNDGKISMEQLELCDAFLFPGGSRIDHELYKILVYAYKKKKPVLGICMGMQAMAIFSVMQEETKNNYMNMSEKEINDLYQRMKNENPTLMILSHPNIHGEVIVNRKNIDDAKHTINIEKDSFLYQTYQSKTAAVVSLHNVVVKRIGPLFKAVAKSQDEVIEAIESINPNLFWIGIQYHPEITKDNLIKNWIEKIKEQKMLT